VWVWVQGQPVIPVGYPCHSLAIAIYESFINPLQEFTDHYLGQASITSCDVLIEKIGTNTEFKLGFTSPSV